jgi:hypothetical protein
MNSRYPDISKLANKVGKQGFKFPVTDARREELWQRVKPDSNLPLHGVSKILAGQLSVRTHVGGKYIMLGYFEKMNFVAALRYADMATIYFAKYKSAHGSSISLDYLERNKGNLRHVFNTSEAEAYQDLERETDIMLYMKEIEDTARRLNLLPDVQTVLQKEKTLQQKVETLEGQLRGIQEELKISRDYIVNMEKWKDEIFREIWRLKPLKT